MKTKRFLRNRLDLAAWPNRTILGLVSVSLWVVFFSATWAQAEDPNKVGLVVVHGDGSVITRCVEFSEDEITGFEAVERSGLDLNYEPSGGMGGAICRLDDEGCTFPEQDCFCQCQGSGDCTFWSYWHLIDGEWQFSGAAAYPVQHGDVDGWLWGSGSSGGGIEPPAISFEEICGQSPTATSTTTPTDTPLPATDTPTATNTPQPTNTPKPPTIAYFSADRTTIQAGESVTLSWDLSNAKAAYLRYEDVEQGVVAPGSRAVSPAGTTIYTLIARNDGGETTAEVSITVLSVSETPVATNTPLVMATPAATSTPPHSETLAPTGPPPPTLGDAPSTEQPGALPTDTPLPSLTATATGGPPPARTVLPTVTPISTATPVPVAAVTPASGIEKRATPRSLLRETSKENETRFPDLVLGVVGIVALLGGLAGMAVILLVVRRDTN